MLTAFIRNLRDVLDSQAFRREFMGKKFLRLSVRLTTQVLREGQICFYKVSNTNAETGSVSMGQIRTRNAVVSFYNMPGIS